MNEKAERAYIELRKAMTLSEVLGNLLEQIYPVNSYQTKKVGMAQDIVELLKEVLDGMEKNLGEEGKAE